MDYKHKYIKYKNEYFILKKDKKMYGGGIDKEKVIKEYVNIEPTKQQDLINKLKEIYEGLENKNEFKDIIEYKSTDFFDEGKNIINNDGTLRNYEVLKYLFDKIPNFIDLKFKDNMNILGFIYENYGGTNEEVVKLVIDHGINLFDKDDKGLTTIDHILNNEAPNNIIKLLIGQLNKNIPEISKISILIASGSEIDEKEKLDKEILEMDDIPKLYKIANIYKNYKIVDLIYNKLKEIYNSYINKYKLNEQNERVTVHPPLWIYNISQIRRYIEDLLNSLKTTLSNESMFENIPNDPKFVKYNSKPYVKNIGLNRYIGYLHLKKFNVPVPESFLILKDNEKKDVTLKIVLSKPVEKTNNISPIIVDSDDFYTITEYIEGEKCTGFQYYDYGFFDSGIRGGNCKNRDGIDYIIDTKTIKNFWDTQYAKDKGKYINNIIQKTYHSYNNTIFDFIVKL